MIFFVDRRRLCLLNWMTVAVALLVSVTYGQQVLYSSEDTDISMRNPIDISGWRPTMAVRNGYGAGGTTPWEWDALVRVDLSSVPIGAKVTSATLYLYYWENRDSYAGGRQLNLYRLTSPWEEETTSWSTRPSKAASPTTYAVVPSSPGNWITWDVTDDVQAHVDGQEDCYGWEVMDEDYWGMPDIPIMGFRTKEYGSFVPHIVVRFSLCGDADGNGVVQIGDAIEIAQYLFADGAAPDPKDLGDVNCDGRINIGDAAYLVAYIFRNGPAPCAECK